jgi:hypothetical protein
MKTKILLIFLILVSSLQAIEVTKTFYANRALYGMVFHSKNNTYGQMFSNNNTIFIGNDNGTGYLSRGYLHFDMSFIPKIATIIESKIHLNFYSSDINPTSVMLKSVNNGSQNYFSSTTDWESLNNSLINEFSVNNGKNSFDIVNNNQNNLNNYISSNSSKKDRTGFGPIGFGIIKSDEATKEVSMSTLDTDIYLTVKFSVDFPVPFDIVAKNITSTSATLFWKTCQDTKLDGVSVCPDIEKEIDGYNIYINGVLTATAKGKNYSVQGLRPATNEIITIRSYKKDIGESTLSPESSITVLTYPLAPTNIVSSNIHSTYLTLSWTPSTGIIAGYKIFDNNNNLIGTTSSSTYAINGLKSNTQHTFIVKSYNASGESTPLTITTNTTILPAPYNVTYQNSSGGWVFNWQYKDGSPIGYNIYQLSPQKQLIATVNNPGSIGGYIYYYFFASLPAGSYTYGISAFDAGGESDILQATKTSLLVEPTNLSVAYFPAPGPGYVLSWTGSSSATEYRIYRKTPNPGLVATTSNTSYVLGPQSAFVPNMPNVYTVSAYSVQYGESYQSSTVGFGYSASRIKSNSILNDSVGTIKPEVELYPNPVKDKLFITGVLNSYDVVLMNAQGQAIYAKTNNSGYIDMSKFKRGIYIVKIRYNGNELINKIVKQ